MTEPVRVLLLSQNPYNESKLLRRFPGGISRHEIVEFTTDVSRPADVVIVVNYVPYDLEVIARKGFIWQWDDEPLIRAKIPRRYSKVFSHRDKRDDKRIITAPPLLDWWIGKSFDELESLDIPRKDREISVIASVKDWKPGHQLRSQFVELAEHSLRGIDVFGQGRKLELEDKWDGLARYKYSIAIENTSKPDYWTEKISDCFLSYTVPFYYGATNISEYFPPDSYVWIPIDRPDDALAVIKDTLAHDNWEARLASVAEARRRILFSYSLYSQVTRLVLEHRDEILSADFCLSLVPGRRTKPGGWIRDTGIRGNIKALLAKRKARRARYSMKRKWVGS
jgi:hypothetical protein